MSRGRVQRRRQGCGPHKEFGAQVGNKRVVPSLQPACSLCASQRSVLLAHACAAVKAVRLTTGLQVTAAQAAGREGRCAGKFTKLTLGYFCNLLRLRLERCRTNGDTAETSPFHRDGKLPSAQPSDDTVVNSKNTQKCSAFCFSVLLASS